MHFWKTSISLRSFFSRTSLDERQHFFHDLSQDNGAFLRFQLLIDIILRLDRSDFARDEILEMCRSKFASDPVELAKVDSFERIYNGKNAITWYTKDCFLYRLLNEPLQTENIELMVKLRYFIHDLHNQLAELQLSFLRSLPLGQSFLTLYRGLTMTMSELNKFRQQEISMLHCSFLVKEESKSLKYLLFTKFPSIQLSLIRFLLLQSNIKVFTRMKMKSCLEPNK
jgi:hypothetical protein